MVGEIGVFTALVIFRIERPNPLWCARVSVLCCLQHCDHVRGIWCGGVTDNVTKLMHRHIFHQLKREDLDLLCTIAWALSVAEQWCVIRP